MNARDKVAHQLGLFFIGNVEQQEEIERLRAKVQELGQKLHEAKADQAGPSGAEAPDAAPMERA